MTLPRLPTLRAAAVAVVLGAAALAAAPAQASSHVSFGFSFGTGPHHFHPAPPRFRPGHPHLRFHFGHGPRFRTCLTQRQLAGVLNRQGYRNISFVRFGPRIAEVRATRGHHRVGLVVDACRGRILDVYRIRGRR